MKKRTPTAFGALMLLIGITLYLTIDLPRSWLERR